jgi:hypothetical protein
MKFVINGWWEKSFFRQVRLKPDDANRDSARTPKCWRSERICMIGRVAIVIPTAQKRPHPTALAAPCLHDR